MFLVDIAILCVKGIFTSVGFYFRLERVRQRQKYNTEEPRMGIDGQVALFEDYAILDGTTSFLVGNLVRLGVPMPSFIRGPKKGQNNALPAIVQPSKRGRCRIKRCFRAKIIRTEAIPVYWYSYACQPHSCRGQQTGDVQRRVVGSLE